MKRIVWTEPATADVRRHKLTNSPLQGERVAALRRRVRGHVPFRIGDYRVFFVCPPADTLEIRRVLHRKEAYR
jgi:mRNA-degrading endonuclease RelE of RelBE toxin-antitoxin system